jgi:putative DNA primase/helicase
MNKPQRALRLAEQSFDVAFFKRANDNEPKAQHVSWSELVERFRTPQVRASKDGELFSPALFNGTRAKENVAHVSMLVLDYDHAADLDNDLRCWRELGCTFMAYTSHSHLRKTKSNPNAEQRFRVVMPLKEPIAAADFPRLFMWAYAVSSGKVDRAARDASRIFYTPAKASRAVEYRFEEVQGAPLDWRALELPELAAEPKKKRDGSASTTTTAGALTLSNDAEPPAMKFAALLENEPKVKRSFEHKRKDLTDQSASSYDLSLATFAAYAGWTDQEIANLIIAHRRERGEDLKTRQDYFARTIAKARTKSEGFSARAESTARSNESARADNAAAVAEVVTHPASAVPAAEAIDGGISSIVDDEERCTDLGNARRLVRRHGRNLRYCSVWKQWLVWDGQRWRIDDDGAAYRLAVETAISIHAEAANPALLKEQRSELSKHARNSESADRLRKMLEVAQKFSSVAIRPDDLDTDPMLFNCTNGTVDLRGGELREHRREDLITRVSPVEYHDGAMCPTWEAFLTRIMDGNARMINFLRRAVGYSLTGDVSERVMFILHGTGANGKSVFTETLFALFDEYAERMRTSTLMHKRPGAATNDVAKLKGARFVSANETPEGGRLAEDEIKDFTGGDTITARFLFSEYFKFKPEFKLWLRTNHLPRVQGTDEGIWDRLRRIPFTVRIPEREQDKHLQQRLAAELPGVLAWAVRGCSEWQRDGLGIPDEVKSATLNYRAEMDSFANFVSECCVFEPALWTPASSLRDAYEQWCRERGERSLLGGKVFANRLAEFGCTTTRRRNAGVVVRCWEGVGLQE